MGDSPRVIDCQQRGEVWREARRGLVTASRCIDVITTLKPPKKGAKPAAEAAKRRNYRAELVVEILTGYTEPRFVTDEMKWGAEHENYARAAYEMQRGVLVETCGFFVHPTVERFGASPDGLVGEDGLAQFKCPNTSTHLAWMRAGKVPLEVAPQLLAELACTGRQWIDFVSFDPRLPKPAQLFIVRFERNEALIAGLEAQVAQFNAEIDAEIAALPQDEPEPAAAAVPEPEPAPIVAPTPEPIRTAPTPLIVAGGERKPHFRDVDPATGKARFADYEEYEAAKDAWLQHDTLRMLLEMISRGPGAIN